MTISLFSTGNLLAWCIVPYDARQRTPQARLEMLKHLGFTQYGYDWRAHHLDTLAEEIRLAQGYDIHIAAVWMWFDKDHDTVGKLSANNQKLLDILQRSGLKTRIWLGFNSNCLDGQDDVTKVQQAANLVRYLRQITASFVTGVGLYNHGDWIGEPENQLKIIDALADPAVGIVYNWHHAHEHLNRFPALLAAMLPHLWTVNLNGMTAGGPKILPLGSGEEDLTLLRGLVESGFQGSVGVLCHVEDEDAETVLQRNLLGLRRLAPLTSGQ